MQYKPNKLDIKVVVLLITHTNQTLIFYKSEQINIRARFVLINKVILLDIIISYQRSNELK